MYLSLSLYIYIYIYIDIIISRAYADTVVDPVRQSGIQMDQYLGLRVGYSIHINSYSIIFMVPVAILFMVIVAILLMVIVAILLMVIVAILY